MQTELRRSWTVSGDDDPVVQGTQKVIALDSHHGAADWAEQLGIGLKATQPLLRQYCVDAVYRDIGRKDPSAAMAMLTKHLAEATDIRLGPIESLSTISEIQALSAVNGPHLMVEAIRAFAVAAGSTEAPEWVRRESLQSLARMLDAREGPVAGELFSAQEISRIHGAIDRLIAVTPSLQDKKDVIARWFAPSGQ